MKSEEIKKNRFWAGTILYNHSRDRVLLQKRDTNAPVNPNLWAFFGGVGEKGEAPEDCVVRELQEELGILVNKGKLMPLRDYLDEKSMTWRFVFMMEFDQEKSHMTLGEGEDFDWVPLDKALKYDLTDNTRSDLEFFINNVKD